MFKYLWYAVETTSFGTTISVFVSTAACGVILSSFRLASVDGNLDERQTIVAWDLLRRWKVGTCLAGILVRKKARKIPYLLQDLKPSFYY